MYYIICIILYYVCYITHYMKSQATSTLPRTARKALIKLGEDIMVARKKRRISTVSMAERAFVSRSTYTKIEKGDPTVSFGAYATVLAILGMADGIGQLADRSQDMLGLDIEEERLPKRIMPPRRKQKRQ